MDKKIKNVLFCGVFSTVFLLAGGYMLQKSLGLILNGEKTTGVIVDVQRRSGSKGGTTYAPVVEFKTTNGQTRRFVSSVSSSSYPKVGQETTLFYNPSQPQEAIIQNFFDNYIFPGIFIFGGLLVPFIFFLLPELTKKAQNKKSARLRSTGQPIQAQVTDISPNGERMNETIFFTVKAQAVDPTTNAAKTYESAAIPFDPTEKMKDRKQVTVYVNPSDPKDYWVDLSFLPNL